MGAREMKLGQLESKAPMWGLTYVAPFLNWWAPIFKWYMGKGVTIVKNRHSKGTCYDEIRLCGHNHI